MIPQITLWCMRDNESCNGSISNDYRNKHIFEPYSAVILCLHISLSWVMVTYTGIERMAAVCAGVCARYYP